MPGKSSKESARLRTEYARFAGLGLQFAATFLVFGALGWWLDRRWGTGPWLMTAGILLGATGAFWSLLHRVQPPAPETPPTDGPPDRGA